MKAIAKLTFIAVAAVAALGTANAVAQRNYDPKTVETVAGKVVHRKNHACDERLGDSLFFSLN